MADKIKLLPCPFCGSANIDAEGWVSTDKKGPACDDCGASADTVKRWNTRAFSFSNLTMAEETLVLGYCKDLDLTERPALGETDITDLIRRSFGR